MNHNELRKLIDHIDRGGKTAREIDPRTGRIISVPVYEGDIGRKIGSTIGGVFGKSAGDRLGQIGSDIGDMFDKPSSEKSKTNAPGSDKPNKNGPANISDFSSGPVAASGAAAVSGGGHPGGYPGDLTQQGKAGEPPRPTAAEEQAARAPGGGYYVNSVFSRKMDAITQFHKNPNSNNGHDGSGIDPNDDPEDPKTWPKGVTKASDFGYLDPNGMWIPTPFQYRDENGDFKTPKNSPANRTGIPHNKWTPFQLKLEKLQNKAAYTSASAIEQTKSVKLPDGAPKIPGFKQVDASQFSTDAREPGLEKTVDWVYAYKKDDMLSKDFVLIAPQLYYNTKLSIGRNYSGWTNGGIRADNDRVPSANGTVFSASQKFNANDMILSVVVNTSIGAGNIGAQILKSISGSLKPL
jgi:hypothetical protein